MANLALNFSPEPNTVITLGTNAVVVIDGQPMASSYEVAQTFQKQHKDVLRRIKVMDCSPDFRQRNFALSEQTVKNGNITKQIPYYRMTFDGFVFLVGSFIGKKAAAFKEAYIARFNWMREELMRRQFEAEHPKAPETLTPEEQRSRSEIVHRKALPYGELQGRALAEIWSRLHHKFRIAKYSQLPRTQLAEAIVYIGQMHLRLPLPPQDPSTQEQRDALHRAIQLATSNWLLGNDSCRSWIHNRLRTEFNVGRLEDIPARRVDEALAMIADIRAKGFDFLTLVGGMREAFCREVIGAGQPWTPWITRQLGGTQALPPNPDWQTLGKLLALSKAAPAC